MGKKSSKQSTGPSKFAKPYIAAGANELRNTLDATKPGLDEITSGLQGGYSDILGRALTPNAGVQAAEGYGADVLSGKYLSGNPYLDMMIGQTANDVENRVNGSIGLRGRTGGDAHSQILTRELANAENGLRFQDYNTERGYMDSAAGRAGGLSAAEYAGIPSLLSYADTAAELPWTGAEKYAGGISGLLGNYNTQTARPSTASSIAKGIGTAAKIGAAVFSDRRVKRDIEKVGEDPDGLGWYKFRYIWSDEAREGVMADEVAQLRPWALGPEIGGYATVNMGAL